MMLYWWILDIIPLEISKICTLAIYAQSLADELWFLKVIYKYGIHNSTMSSREIESFIRRLNLNV
jgi:hypothetical protein